MSDNRRCPCGHVHPSGMGASLCNCKDCFLLWTDIPFEYLRPDLQERLRQLVAAQ